MVSKRTILLLMPVFFLVFSTATVVFLDFLSLPSLFLLPFVASLFPMGLFSLYHVSFQTIFQTTEYPYDELQKSADHYWFPPSFSRPPPPRPPLCRGSIFDLFRQSIVPAASSSKLHFFCVSLRFFVATLRPSLRFRFYLFRPSSSPMTS